MLRVCLILYFLNSAENISPVHTDVFYIFYTFLDSNIWKTVILLVKL